MDNTTPRRDYRPFIPECSKRGIGKTKAYELANAGLLDVFLIGTKRYIFIDSLDALPTRLAEMQNQGGPAPVRPQPTRTTHRQASMRGVRS